MERDINDPVSRNDLHDLYTDEETRNKIRKHYSDPNDKITEQDIANVNTEIYQEPLTDEEQDAIDKEVDDETNKKAPSAWDIKTDE